MTSYEAAELVKQITYKPNYEINVYTEGKDFIRVALIWTGPDTSIWNAPEYKEMRPTTTHIGVINVRNKNRAQVLKAVLDLILEAETHEAREYFRVRPSLEAPFHPHQLEGDMRWELLDEMERRAA